LRHYLDLYYIFLILLSLSLQEYLKYNDFELNFSSNNSHLI
jgi:hypothetical protein